MIQMKDPIETSELLAFVRVVDAKSFSRAAAELNVPRATIGRRLTRLEQRLGARLLRRTTRSLALTDAGELFGAAGVILPALARTKPVLTPVAATAICVLMVLGAGYHLLRGELSSVPINFGLGAIAAFVAWGRFRAAPIT